MLSAKPQPILLRPALVLQHLPGVVVVGVVAEGQPLLRVQTLELGQIEVHGKPAMAGAPTGVNTHMSAESVHNCF